MKKGILLCFALLLVISEFSFILAAPRSIYSTDTASLLTIPRYKMVMSSSDPNTIWLMFAAGRYDDLMKSSNGGTIWQILPSIRDYLSDHSSVSIDNLNNIYVADRQSSTQVFFRKINSPGETTGDFVTSILVDSPFAANVYLTPNVLALNSTHIFIFLRKGEADGNVWYRLSTDGGLTFPQSGWVTQTGIVSVRIGSLIIDGKAAIVIHYYTNSNNYDYRYFIWDGTQFVANSDATIVSGESTNMDRAYSMSYVNGYLHLVYNKGNILRHAWKRYNDGSSVWNNQIVDSNSYTASQGSWMPSLSVHGNDLYLFYAEQTSDTTTTTNVYYRKWNETSQTFSQEYPILTDSQDNQYPQGPAIINPSANYIPVAWTRNGEIWYDSIPVAGYTCTDSDTDTYYLYNATNCPIGNDCNDTNSAIHPGAAEICGDTIDQDCSGADLVCAISPDVNSDGFVNIIDLALTTYWQGRTTVSGDGYKHLDQNGDGNINWIDVLMIITNL